MSSVIIKRHRVIQTPHVIIKQITLLSNKSCYYQTTHVIIKHLMLLSTPQPIILVLHIVAQLAQHSRSMR